MLKYFNITTIPLSILLTFFIFLFGWVTFGAFCIAVFGEVFLAIGVYIGTQKTLAAWESFAKETEKENKNA